MIPGNQAHIYSKEILGAGERAADLTRQLLAFSRRQVLQPKVLDLNEVVRDTQKILRRVIGEDIELICNLDPGLGAVEADLNQMQQVLMNLSVNARDAMPDGGKLTIETSNVELHANSGKERLEAAVAPRVVIVFSDTGHGMDLATQQRIFEPFFTTKGPGKGTGLGLSIVYGILRQSNGSIAVESEMGKGTTFRIDLPRIERRTETVHALTPLPRAAGTETILLVEDQTEVRRFAAASLQSYGYHVIEASNGQEALQLHNTIEEPIHLVLTDIVMPGITGVELSRRLQLQNPRVKVLLVSGYADSVILRHGILDSGIALLQKPYSPAALALKIRELLGPPRNCSAV